MGIIFFKVKEENFSRRAFLEERRYLIKWERKNGNTVSTTVEKHIFDRNVEEGKWVIVNE